MKLAYSGSILELETLIAGILLDADNVIVM